MKKDRIYAQFTVKRRPSLDEDIKVLNKHLVEQFVTLPSFWGAGKKAADAPLMLWEGQGRLDLRKPLAEGLDGQVSYCARFAGCVNVDIGMNDDSLLFGMDTTKVDYADFCRVTLPKLIEIFGPYRAQVTTDDTVKMADWEIVKAQSNETGRDIDGRDSAYRIWPVCYFDDLLCQRSFGITAADVVERAAPECERAEQLRGGAFLIVTTDIVTGLGLDVLNARLMARLTAPSTNTGRPA